MDFKNSTNIKTHRTCGTQDPLSDDGPTHCGETEKGENMFKVGDFIRISESYVSDSKTKDEDKLRGRWVTVFGTVAGHVGVTTGEGYKAWVLDCYVDTDVPTKNVTNDDAVFDDNGKPHILDSGARTEYETGAVRDVKEGKGRCDLLPFNEIASVYNSADLIEEAAFFQNIQKFKSTGCVTFLYDIITGSNPFKSLEELTLELSKHFEEGALKYGEGNWCKGIPVHSYIDSALRHYVKYKAGWTDEPHDRAFIWNLICCAWTMDNKPEMDDFTEVRKNDKS